MKVKLNIIERLSMGAILPAKGAMLEVQTSKSIIDKVKTTDNEKASYNILDKPGGGVTWDNDKEKKDNYEVEYNFEKAEMQLLKKQVKDKDEKKEITMQILSLCEKFM